MWAGHQRPQRRQIQINTLVVYGVLVRQILSIVRPAALRGKKPLYLLIGREDRARRPHFSAHVRNGSPLRHLQRFHARADVFIDLTQSALHAFAPQQFKNDVLGIYARSQLAGQMDLHDSRHLQPHGHASHGRGYIHSAHTDAEHPDRAAVRRVTVAAHADLARHTKARQMHRVTNPVSGPGKVNAEPFGRTLQVNMIVRRHIVDIQQIVVQIADRTFRAHARQPDRLKGQIGHNSVNIVGQSLINPDKKLLARPHTAADKMLLQNLPGQRFSHKYAPSLFTFCLPASYPSSPLYPKTPRSAIPQTSLFSDSVFLIGFKAPDYL